MSKDEDWETRVVLCDLGRCYLSAWIGTSSWRWTIVYVLLEVVVWDEGRPSFLYRFLIRAIYVEMLGHDCSLAYFNAVKLTQEKQIMAKRIGYLACNIFLHKDHEFMLLLINTMQRDLKSTNHLEVGSRNHGEVEINTSWSWSQAACI